jgi:hypothetical protein
MITLPTIKSSPKVSNSKFLVYFGKPKSGKTTIASKLDNNLIIDLENGTDFVSAMVLKANNVGELSEIAAAIVSANKEAGKFVYDYITIDNGTKLEEMIMPLALQLYQLSPQGKNYNDDVRKLPNGAGWLYIREAFFKVIDMYKTLAPTLILICHVKDAMINKDGKELSEMSIDLSGKTARLVAADADAIGFVYRKKNQTILNFNGGGDFIVEARQPHLRGQEIVIAESDEDNNITTFWDKVFLPNND